VKEALEYVQSEQGTEFNPTLAAHLPLLKGVIRALCHENGAIF
jgi:hypothetical protein